MAFTGLDFIINGVKSVDIGVNGCYLVKTDASQISYPLMGSKSLLSKKKLIKETLHIFTE